MNPKLFQLFHPGIGTLRYITEFSRYPINVTCNGATCSIMEGHYLGEICIFYEITNIKHLPQRTLRSYTYSIHVIQDLITAFLHMRFSIHDLATI